MADYGHDLLFGCFLTPDAGQAEAVVELARLADRLGLDLLGVQDHPYQPRFLDTWTLLSTLAGQTERIRLVPDVVNLPLRPPAVLARSAASLDILSGGRVELGLGSGAFAKAVGSMGGPQRGAGEAVEALEEAITVIRALWAPGPAVTFKGKYHSLDGAQPGPMTPHPIEIWLGSYKPRMLRLTGKLADGWIPSLGYASPDELVGMNAIIDEAAREAGRDPAAVRRVFNLSGRFASVERGYLQGPTALWIAQVTELVIEKGMSAFVMGPGDDAVGDLQRFAAEVAPGVREAVASARAGTARASTGARPVEIVTAAQEESVAGLATAEAPHSALLDEALRPHAEELVGAKVTRTGRESAETLVAVHDHLRGEMAEIQRAAVEVAAGRLEPAAARSVLNRTTMRQNYWTLGAFCARFCRFVTVHHTIEDRTMFPALGRMDAGLAAVLERLREEHEIIAGAVERFDESLTAMVADPAAIAGMQELADELSDALVSHLAYEERELVGPLGRSSIAV